MAERFILTVPGLGDIPVEAETREEARARAGQMTQDEVLALRQRYQAENVRESKNLGISVEDVEAMRRQTSQEDVAGNTISGPPGVATTDTGFVAQAKRAFSQQISGVRQFFAEMSDSQVSGSIEQAIALEDEEAFRMFDALDEAQSNFADVGEFAVPIAEIMLAAGGGFLVAGPPGAVIAGTAAGIAIGGTKFQEANVAAERGLGTRAFDAAFEGLLARFGLGGRAPGTVSVSQFAKNKSVSFSKKVGNIWVRVQQRLGGKSEGTRDGIEAAVKLLQSGDDAQVKLGRIALNKYRETFDNIPFAFSRRAGADAAASAVNKEVAEGLVGTIRAIATESISRTPSGPVLDMTEWVARTSGLNRTALKQALTPKVYEKVIQFDDLMRTFAGMGETVTADLMEQLVKAAAEPGMGPLLSALTRATTEPAKRAIARRILSRAGEGVREAGGRAVRVGASRLPVDATDAPADFVRDLFHLGE